VPSVTRRSNNGRIRREAVEQRVLTAVEELLEQGESFTGLGIQRIADQAGIARSTFYVHFPDKTDLLMKLTASATDALFGVAADWARDSDADFDALHQATTKIVFEYRQHAALLKAFAEVTAYDPDVAEFWRERIAAVADILRKRLERDKRAGRVAKDLQCAAAGAWISWGTERTVAQHMLADVEGKGDKRLALGIAQGIWAVMNIRDEA
jgi:AcrR family transcriptional regulator